MDTMFCIYKGCIWFTCRERVKLNKLHPRKWTNENIDTMRSQLKLLGLSIDWDREVSTCDKKYYKHQQELFIDFYNVD